MGCTSAKPKRTTSIEDVGAKPREPNQVPDKNGQVTKREKPSEKVQEPSKTSETNAIEIPGAHKSFMAPDGIPFIDEDVESELDDGTTQPVPPSAVNDSRNVKHGSPDQNKNVTIVINKEVKVANAEPVTATKSSALRETAPRLEESRKETVTVTSEPVVIADIKIKEIQITTTKNQETDSSEARNRSTLTDDEWCLQAKREEELAATKIQAGIRGFLDRQKVKAIRANKEEEEHKEDAQQQSGPKVTEHVEETEVTVDGPHDPKLDAAATKIQANYKGYRIRKEIKTTHSK